MTKREQVLKPTKWEPQIITVFLTRQYAGSSVTYKKETRKKWENEKGETTHMKVSMAHNEDDCARECTATAPCVAFTFVPTMEICALKAAKDAVTLVPASMDVVSGILDGERPVLPGKELDSNICLPCLPGV